jgi:tetratricopeptide (TPR) repeat protein
VQPNLRAPNPRLRALIAEARWTGQGLARAVNGAGAELGLALTYDRTAVSHWLSGSRPPATVARLVAEAFSRRLGRVVSVQDTGLGPPGLRAAAPADGGSGIDDGAARLLDLCAAEADPSRRAALRDLVYSVAALHPATTSTGGDVPEQRRAGGSRQADAVRTMAGFFSQADKLFGGGHIRPALTGYLSGDVARWLRDLGASGDGHELGAAVAELGHLAALACFDSGLNGLAQRYHLASLSLARYSGDTALQATILRGMSVQADSLRHAREALALAEAADARGGHLPSRRAAALAGQLAVAYAANGLLREASAQLRRASELLEKHGSADESIDAYHHSALEHHTAVVLAAGGNRRAAIAALTSSIRQRPDGERRARALTIARLAHLQLDVGHLEAACASIDLLCADSPYLHSVRVADALDALRMRLRPFSRNPEARTTLARISALGH